VNSPTGSSEPSPSKGGVFPADPFNPPPPPADAIARVIFDTHGEIIAYGWVRGRDDGQSVTDVAWDWFDAHGHTSPPPITSYLTLLPRAD
jgi:hypothetical protein